MALATVGASVAAAFAGGGYLVMVGPKPLRFALVKERIDPATALPPLIMIETAPTNAPASEEIFGPPAPLAGPSEPPVRPEPVFAEPFQADPARPRPATPETLLQFFTPGKQGSTIITTPVEFSPPSARTPGESRATYISQ